MTTVIYGKIPKHKETKQEKNAFKKALKELTKKGYNIKTL